MIRIVELIKLHEHLVQCLPEGFKFLVENYNCKGMIHNVIQEVTEWQTNEKYQDAQVRLNRSLNTGFFNSFILGCPILLISSG